MFFSVSCSFESLEEAASVLVSLAKIEPGSYIAFFPLRSIIYTMKCLVSENCIFKMQNSINASIFTFCTNSHGVGSQLVSC